MNILYLGNAQGFLNSDKFYLTPQKLINGFTRLGHNVYVFNDRDFARYSNVFRSQAFGRKRMNAKVLEVCKSFRPELIVLGHCKNVANETLAEVRRILPGVKMLYRNVDPLSSPQNVQDIHQRVGQVEGIFITTAGDCLNQFSNDFGGVYFVPNPVDPHLERKRAFENEAADIDFLFLASSLRDQQDHRHMTAKFLIENKGNIRLRIGGAGVNKDQVFGAEYYEVLARSKMGLCMNKTEDYYLYASDRMSQYMGSGVLAFIPEGPQFEDILGSDAFVSFKTNEELLEKILYFLTHDDKRRAIARRGYEKVHDFFHVDKVCRFMIECVFDLPLSLDYHWPTERH